MTCRGDLQAAHVTEKFVNRRIVASFSFNLFSALRDESCGSARFLEPLGAAMDGLVLDISHSLARAEAETSVWTGYHKFLRVTSENR